MSREHHLPNGKPALRRFLLFGIAAGVVACGMPDIAPNGASPVLDSAGPNPELQSPKATPSSDRRSDLAVRSVTLGPRDPRAASRRHMGPHHAVPPTANSSGTAPGISTPDSFKPFGANTLALYKVPNEAGAGDWAAFQGGQIIDNADVQLIFWGAEWSSLNAPSAGAVTNAMNAMFATTYFESMRQYGYQALRLRGPIQVQNAPPNNFTFDDVGNLVWDLIDQGTFAEPDEPGGKALYLVVMPQSVNSSVQNARGAHGAPGDYDFPGGWTYAWAAWSGYGTVDYITDVLSHEIVEALSDPEPQVPAWVMNRSINGNVEIGDACNNTVDRLDGVLVQAYFSQIDHLCAIPFPAGPTVNFLSPAAGPPGGGTLVRIDGTGFETNGNTSVTFGGLPARSISCPSSIQCYATAPAGNGIVDVIVTRNRFSSPIAASAKFAYVPSVTGVDPATANVGDLVTIHGIGFSWAPGATSISFGASAATNFSCYPGPDCTALVPPGAGTVHVVVTVNGTPSTKWARDQFSYPAPGISSIDLASGSIAGGTYVNLFGKGFDPAIGGTHVYFGNAEASYVNCTSSTWCYVRSPAAASFGWVHITFSAFGVGSAPGPGDWFDYVPAAVKSISWGLGSGSVALNGYAPASGLAITFTSSDPGAVVPPATLWVPPGTDGGSFGLTFPPIDHAETVTLTASGGGASVSTSVSVSAWPALSVQLGTDVLGTNASSTATISLATAAPAGGASVALVSSDPAAIPLPAVVSIPGGGHQAVVPITNFYAGAPKVVRLTATYAGNSSSGSLSVPSAIGCQVRTCQAGWYWNQADCACERGVPR